MKRILLLSFIAALLLLDIAACKKKTPDPNGNGNGNGNGTNLFTLASSAMVEGGFMPRAFTCDTSFKVFPPLSWSNAPAGTMYYALFMDNIDYDNVATKSKFCHWVLFNLLSTTNKIDKGINLSYPIPDDSTLIGTNDNNGVQYGTPCPATTVTNNYKFTLYALSARCNLKLQATKAQVIKEIANKTLGTATLTVKYTGK